MSVPILKQGPFLVGSIQAALSDRELVQLRDDLARRIGEQRIRGLVLDVSALDVMDSFACRVVRGIAIAAKLRGADTVVAGIQPEVAMSMVQLGLTLDEVRTALDLEEGLELLQSLRGGGLRAS